MRNDKIELNPNQIVLVIGGRGFIGRHIVEQLENLGACVVVGSRANRTQLEVGSRQVRLHDIQSVDDCKAVLKEVDIVINAVGILRQRFRESYEQVHHLAVSYLATACAKKGIRFVNISALGLTNPVKSRFLSSKRAGELAIQKAQGDWYICRPSLVDGDGGYGAQWFRRVAKWPIHFAPANANSQLAPINVNDLGEAVAKIALSTNHNATNAERIVELGGDRRMTVLDYLRALNNDHAPPNLKVPAWLARLFSHIFDLLHLTPFSFGHYELLKFDNVPSINRTRTLLGRHCRDFGETYHANEGVLI